jgi:tetratricopeptide (TPR) repeat protein
VRALAVVITLGLCGLAKGAPKYERTPHTPSTSTDPAMVAAERKWTIAAAARGPAQTDLWEDAAVAFIAIAEAGKLADADLALAARSALAALKNSMTVDPRVREKPPSKFDPDPDRIPVPQELTPRDQRMLRVLDVAARFETAEDRVALVFMRANLLRRYDQLDKAIPIFLEIIASHPEHRLAENSANLALDSYNRLRRYDEMLALANKLRLDKKLLANRDELANTVRQLHARGQRLVAHEASTRARETGDHRYYEKCAVAYLSIIEDAPRRSDDDELLYNAFVCFEQAGAIDRANDVLRRQKTDFPNSQLTRRAELRVIDLLARVGRFDEAATAGEQWVGSNFFESETPDLLDNTIRWRSATGGLDAALRVLDRYLVRAKKVPLATDRSAFTALFLAERFLDQSRAQSPPDAARSRAVAVRLVSRPPPHTRKTQTDPDSRLDIARIVAAAACPIPLVDGLCPRTRDASLMAIARRELSRVQRPNDAVTLFLADLALEAILAKRAPTANLDADYHHLASSADSAVRVAAHARLAAFAKHVGDIARQTAQLDACIAEARVSSAGHLGASAGGAGDLEASTADPWFAICDRQLTLVTAETARTPRARDVLPALVAPVPFAIEAPRRSLPVVQPRRAEDEIQVFDFDDDVIEP